MLKSAYELQPEHMAWQPKQKYAAIHWSFKILTIPHTCSYICQKWIFVPALMIFFSILFSTEYFSCVLATSSLPLTKRTVHFTWYLANISLCFSQYSLSPPPYRTAQWVSDFHPPSFFPCLPAASPLFAHELLPAPGPSLLLLHVLLEARTSLLQQTISTLQWKNVADQKNSPPAYLGFMPAAPAVSIASYLSLHCLSHISNRGSLNFDPILFLLILVSHINLAL